MRIRRPFLFVLLLWLVAFGYAAAAGAQEDKPPSWRDQMNEAVGLLRAKQYDKAKEKANEALSSAPEGEKRPLEAQTRNFLGRIHELAGENDEALAEYKAALELFKQVGDKRGQGTVTSNLVRLYATLGKEASDAKRQEHYEKVESYFRQTAEILGPESPLTVEGYRLLAETYEERDLEDAVDRSAEAVEVLDRTGKRGELLASSLVRHGRFLEAAGQRERATTAFEHALEIRSNVLEPGDLRIAESFRHLARVVCLAGKRGTAAALLERAYAMMHRLGDEHDSELVRIAVTLDRLSAVLKRDGEAKSDALRFSRDVLKALDGPEYKLERRVFRTLTAPESSDAAAQKSSDVAVLKSLLEKLTSPEDELPLDLEYELPLRKEAVLEDLRKATLCGAWPRSAEQILPSYVAERQRRLRLLGHFDGEIDGKAGPDMATAVHNFRKAEGLEEGPLDASTDAELEEKLQEETQPKKGA